MRREILALGRVHRRRTTRDGPAARAPRPPLCGDQIPESHDLQEAQAPAPEEDLQAASEELAKGESDEHQCRDLGQAHQALRAFHEQRQEFGKPTNWYEDAIFSRLVSLLDMFGGLSCNCEF